MQLKRKLLLVSKRKTSCYLGWLMIDHVMIDSIVISGLILRLGCWIVIVIPWIVKSGFCSIHFSITLAGLKNVNRYLRNRKHVPCFYRVIETRVEVWENEKCCGNTSRRRVFPQLLRVLPNFHECLIETRRTCFLFLLENTATRKRKHLVNFDYQNVNSLCSRHHYVNSAC